MSFSDGGDLPPSWAGADENTDLGMLGNLSQPQRHAPEIVIDRHREMSQKVHP
jgi:hypothetical protein